MYHLASCPACETLQIQKDLGSVPYRTCRSCEKRVAAPSWTVLHTYGSFEPAKRDLRIYTKGAGRDTSLSAPPIPRAVLPLSEGGPNQRRRLADLLHHLAEADEVLTEDELTARLAEIDCAHLRRHLLREGLVYQVGEVERDADDEGAEAPRRYRVSRAALEVVEADEAEP